MLAGVEESTSVIAPLKKSVTVLVVDDDPIILAMYDELISDHPLYSVISASSSRMAEKIIRADTPIYLAIFDLGLSDIGNDEFYLLKKYARKIPFVVVSGADDVERGFRASKNGAVDLVSKPVNFSKSCFWDSLTTAFLRYTILPGLTAPSNSLLADCCRLLVDNEPSTVSEWSRHVNITTSYMRRLWSECSSFSPKHVLFMYKLYKSAFKYYNAKYLKLHSNLTSCDYSELRRNAFYYLQNKRVLDAIRDE